MDEELYDEFGNYIGPDLEEEDEEEEESESGEGVEEPEEERMEVDSDDEKVEASMAVVLHEDKQYYPGADTVYPEAETMVEEEDHQTVEEPIIRKQSLELFHLHEDEIPGTEYDKKFLIDLLDYPELIRSVCVSGCLHHGKTSLLDMFVEKTHDLTLPDLPRHLLFTDTRNDERDRAISLKATPLTLCLQNLRSKSYAMNFLDTPGHIDFLDEVTAAQRLSDGCIVVVDAVEGCLSHTGQVIRQCLEEGLRMVLVVNKIDRLMLELKLPPRDFYVKLRHVIEEANALIRAHAAEVGANEDGDGVHMPFSPIENNVCFASAKFGFAFTLKSLASLYIERQGMVGVRPDVLARKLWGKSYYSPKDRRFFSETVLDDETGAELSNSFVSFAIEPIYKLISTLISEDSSECFRTLKELGIHIKKAALKMEVEPLLKRVLQLFFSNSTESIVDSVVETVKSPKANAVVKARHCLTGEPETPLWNALVECSGAEDAPLVISVSKIFESPDCRSLSAFGRVMSGRVNKNQEVRILGEIFSAAGAEDVATKSVSSLNLHVARYDLPLQSAGPGAWVLLGGVEETMTDATATILGPSVDLSQAAIFRPLHFVTPPLVKVAIEPRIPKELHQLVDAIRKVSATHPAFKVKVEDYGERDLYANGELYLDVVLYEIRELYSKVEVKVSDPFVCFAETIQETSSIPCSASSPNGLNRLTMIAEPLDPGLEADLVNPRVDFRGISPRAKSKFLKDHYHWDRLASRSVWDVGPSDSICDSGSSLLLEYTLPTETNQELLESVKQPIIQGFQFAVREGPLCSEIVRNVKFKLISAEVDADPINRQWSQLIPTARRAAYASLLTAVPRLLEPICAVEVLCSEEAVKGVYHVLGRRRGHVVEDIPKPGSPSYVVRGLIPMLDIFGFETDLRIHTLGKAFPFVRFDHWQEVRGDPLDLSVSIRPLEPAAGEALARDFLVKTRRRKGLDIEVDVAKYLDAPREIATLEPAGDTTREELD